MQNILPMLLDGLQLTILLLFLSAIGGIIVAIPMALAWRANNRFLYSISYVYVFVFRGTPALVQLFFIYYGLAQFEYFRNSIFWVIFNEPFWCGLFALSLNTGAYTTEILRGALKAVPQGEVEAALALGLNKFQIFKAIELPIAFRIALPAYGNELILLAKATSIVSTITLMDLMGMAKLLYTESFDPFAPLLTAGFLYLGLIFIITQIILILEYILFPLRREDMMFHKWFSKSVARVDLVH